MNLLESIGRSSRAAGTSFGETFPHAHQMDSMAKTGGTAMQIDVGDRWNRCQPEREAREVQGPSRASRVHFSSTRNVHGRWGPGRAALKALGGEVSGRRSYLLGEVVAEEQRETHVAETAPYCVDFQCMVLFWRDEDSYFGRIGKGTQIMP